MSFLSTVLGENSSHSLTTLLDHLRGVCFSSRWVDDLVTINEREWLASHLGQCVKALEALQAAQRQGKISANALKSEEYRVAYGRVERKVSAIRDWTPWARGEWGTIVAPQRERLAGEEEKLQALLQGLNISIGELGESVGIAREELKLPMTWAETNEQHKSNFSNQTENHLSTSAEGSGSALDENAPEELKLLSALADNLWHVTREREHELEQWTPPANDPRTAQSILAQLSASIRNIRALGEQNLRTGKVELHASTSVAIRNTIESIEQITGALQNWEVHLRSNNGHILERLGSSKQLKLKEQLGSLIIKTNSIAALLRVKPAQARVPPRYKKSNELPEEETNLAKHLSRFGRWKVMSERRATIYGLL